MACVEVPATVQALARGTGADDWLAGLPDLVGRLERDWRITIGPAYPDATEAFVAPGRARGRHPGRGQVADPGAATPARRATR